MSTTVADVLTSLVRQAAEATGYGDSPVPLEPCVATKDAAHGDYQSNFAFRLGRALRTNPRVVAQSIVDAIPANAVVREVEVAGPGFVNALRTSYWMLLLVSAIMIAAAALTLGLGTMLDLSPETIAGAYAGSVTSTSGAS